MTRSGTRPPASAAVRAVAVSVVLPTSESLTFASGFFFRYSATESFWPIPVNDQNSNSAFGSPDPAFEPPPAEHPEIASATAPINATGRKILRRFTAVPLLRGQLIARRRTQSASRREIDLSSPH